MNEVEQEYNPWQHTLYWCHSCFGHSRGEDRCNACGTPRNFKRVTYVKREVRPKEPPALRGGVAYQGRILRAFDDGRWTIYTIWETENHGRIYYPATRPVDKHDKCSYPLMFPSTGSSKYARIMDHLGQYLVNVDTESPFWRCVDVVSGELIDTTNWGLINDTTSLEDDYETRTRRDNLADW